MSNLRSNIRTEILSLLADANIEIDSVPVNIYNHRFMPILDSDLPAIIVYSLGDDATKSRDEQALDRVEDIRIVVQVSGEESPDESGDLSAIQKIDYILGIIESILNKKRQTLNKNIYRLNYSGTKININVDGSSVYGIASMSYSARYQDQLTD